MQSEVSAICDVEDFGPEIQRVSFAWLESLTDRQVQIDEAIAANGVPTDISDPRITPRSGDCSTTGTALYELGYSHITENCLELIKSRLQIVSDLLGKKS